MLKKIHEAFLNFCEAIIWMSLLAFPVGVLFYIFFSIVFGGVE